MNSLASAQGQERWPSLSSFFQRGTTPYETWYVLGAQNQSALVTTSYSFGSIRAFPFAISRNVVIDRLAFEVTTAAPGAVGRVGIYRATSQTELYGSSLVVDGGEQDCSTTGVKAATVNVGLTAGIYLYVHLGGVDTITVRTIPLAGRQPLFGTQDSFSVPANSIEVGRSYGALPSTFPNDLVGFGSYPSIVVAARFA